MRSLLTRLQPGHGLPLAEASTVPPHAAAASGRGFGALLLRQAAAKGPPLQTPPRHLHTLPPAANGRAHNGSDTATSTAQWALGRTTLQPGAPDLASASASASANLALPTAAKPAQATDVLPGVVPGVVPGPVHAVVSGAVAPVRATATLPLTAPALVPNSTALATSSSPPLPAAGQAATAPTTPTMATPSAATPMPMPTSVAQAPPMQQAGGTESGGASRPNPANRGPIDVPTSPGLATATATATTTGSLTKPAAKPAPGTSAAPAAHLAPTAAAQTAANDTPLAERADDKVSDSGDAPAPTDANNLPQPPPQAPGLAMPGPLTAITSTATNGSTPADAQAGSAATAVPTAPASAAANATSATTSATTTATTATTVATAAGKASASMAASGAVALPPLPTPGHATDASNQQGLQHMQIHAHAPGRDTALPAQPPPDVPAKALAVVANASADDFANVVANVGTNASTSAMPGLTLPAPAAAAVGASLAAEARLPLALDDPGFAAAMGTQVSVLVRDGVQTANLQLNPPEMGPVAVQIMLDGHAARVDFQADLAATRAVIDASLPALAAALQDAGFTLSGGGVFQQAPGRQGQGEPPPAPGQAQPSNSPARPGPGGAAPGVAARLQRGLVDLVA